MRNTRIAAVFQRLHIDWFFQTYTDSSHPSLEPKPEEVERTDFVQSTDHWYIDTLSNTILKRKYPCANIWDIKLQMKAPLCKIKLENIKGGTSCSSDSAGGPSSLSRLLKRARAELAGRIERTYLEPVIQLEWSWCGSFLVEKVLGVCCWNTYHEYGHILIFDVSNFYLLL